MLHDSIRSDIEFTLNELDREILTIALLIQQPNLFNLLKWSL